MIHSIYSEATDRCQTEGIIADFFLKFAADNRSQRGLRRGAVHLEEPRSETTRSD